MGVIIIAEVGTNSNGDFRTLRKMISVAKRAKVDFLKTQQRCCDNYSDKLYNSPLFGKIPYKEHKKKLEFNKEEYDKFDIICKNFDIKWFASTFDIESLLFIEDYDPKFHKIPSPKNTDLKFIEEVAMLKRPTIMSNGMCTEEELDKAINTFLKTNNSLFLLHTTSIYPLPDFKVNLNYMRTMHKKYNLPTGYSSHDPGIPISVAAVGMGAKIIEKHFTLDRTMKGTDHAASLEPLGLDKLVRYIRSVEKAFGSNSKQFYDEEKEVREKVKNK